MCCLCSLRHYSLLTLGDLDLCLAQDHLHWRCDHEMQLRIDHSLRDQFQLLALFLEPLYQL